MHESFFTRAVVLTSYIIISPTVCVWSWTDYLLLLLLCVCVCVWCCSEYILSTDYGYAWYSTDANTSKPMSCHFLTWIGWYCIQK
jgi:hypothetical protein